MEEQEVFEVVNETEDRPESVEETPVEEVEVPVTEAEDPMAEAEVSMAEAEVSMAEAEVSTAEVEEPVEEDEGSATEAEEPVTLEEPTVLTQAEMQSPAEPKKAMMNKKTLLMIVGGAAAVAIIAFLVVFLTVIKPNRIYDQAMDALKNGDFYECERLMAKIPDHKHIAELRRDLNVEKAKKHISNGDLDLAESILADIPEDEEIKSLKGDIRYQRAEELVAEGKYEEAQQELDKLGDREDPLQLKEQVKYANALATLETGDYETAYDLFSQLGEYEDAVEQKEMVYNEALAFKILFVVQPTLKNPASLRVTDIGFYETGTMVGALFNINASNSYGGNVGGYIYDVDVYDGEDDAGMIDHSSYVRPSDYIDVLEQLIVDRIKMGTKMEVTVDIARMNRLLESNASFKIDLPFQAEEEVVN